MAGKKNYLTMSYEGTINFVLLLNLYFETYFAGIAKRLGRQNTSVGTRQGTARLAQSDHNK
jgi:hypothetical protein